jgi:HK97 family phage major capsid protein
MTLKEKIDKRATLVTNMRAMLNKSETDKKPFSADDETTYQNMETEVTSLTKDIQRANALADTESKLRAERDGSYKPAVVATVGGGDRKITARARPGIDGNEGYMNALDVYHRKGRQALTPEHVNALQVGADSEGGYLVPVEFETKLIELLTNLDPVRRLATVITTASDKNIPIETSKGTFAYIGEEGTYPKSDPSVGRIVLSAFKSGGIIQISEELLQDSFFDLISYLQRLAGYRYNALESTSFAVGNGVAKPLGLFATTAVGGVALTGTTGAVSASAAITADNLVDTFHGLARAYRQRATWLTSDTMIKMIRKLKTGVSGDNTYLWQPGLAVGQPDAILGRPVEVSDDATAPAPDAKSIIFGDLSHYYIGDRLGTQVQRLNELYAESGQVGFKFTRRNDGRLTNAAAVTFFTHGAAA